MKKPVLHFQTLDIKMKMLWIFNSAQNNFQFNDILTNFNVKILSSNAYKLKQYIVPIKCVYTYLKWILGENAYNIITVSVAAICINFTILLYHNNDYSHSRRWSASLYSEQIFHAGYKIIYEHVELMRRKYSY